MTAIRQQAYAFSAGEYRAGIAGLAAPRFDKDGEVLGSIALATSTDSPQLAAFKALAPTLIDAAARISQGIAKSAHVVDLPACALG